MFFFLYSLITACVAIRYFYFSQNVPLLAVIAMAVALIPLCKVSLTRIKPVRCKSFVPKVAFATIFVTVFSLNALPAITSVGYFSGWRTALVGACLLVVFFSFFKLLIRFKPWRFQTVDNVEEWGMWCAANALFVFNTLSVYWLWFSEKTLLDVVVVCTYYLSSLLLCTYLSYMLKSKGLVSQRFVEGFASFRGAHAFVGTVLSFVGVLSLYIGGVFFAVVGVVALLGATLALVLKIKLLAHSLALS